MIGTISFDRAAAKRVEAPARIRETGAYAVKIQQADQYDTQNGATMLRFRVQADDGAIAWITLCVLKTDGTEAFGMGVFHALMANCGVNSVEWTAGKIKNSKDEMVPGFRGKALEGKRVGMLLQSEERTLNDGKVIVNMNLVTSFDPDTRLTYSEKETGVTEARRVDERLKYLLEHPKRSSAPHQAGSIQAAPHTAPEQGIDSDMPF